MNMWLVIVIYCDLWFTIMVVIYCEKMGSVWYIYVYIWNACVDGMQKTKKIKFLSLCRGRWPKPSAKKGPLPRALAIALGKDFFEKSWKFLCRGPGSRPSAKVFKKIQKKLFLCRGPALSKQFFFKKKTFAEGPCNSPRQSFFWEKSWKFLCRGRGRRPSAKI